MRLCHSVSDVGRLGTGPKVVLASGLSLGSGMARELLLQWGPDARNAVIFTQQPRVSGPAGETKGTRDAQSADDGSDEREQQEGSRERREACAVAEWMALQASCCYKLVTDGQGAWQDAVVL